MELQNNTNTFIHLHVHTQSGMDADIPVSKAVEKCKEMGWPGLAVTDHGVVANLFDYYEGFSAAGLKLGWGCEIYVDGGILGRLHAVILAKNNKGWKGLSKLVTLSNGNVINGYPIVTIDMLNQLFGKLGKYHGAVILTSACMQGVVPAIFRLNETVEKEISKLTTKQNKYVSPADNRLAEITKKVDAENDAIKNLIAEREVLTKLSKATFTKREKALAKLSPDSPDYEEVKKQLEDDKKASEEAGPKLETVKKEIVSHKKNLSLYNKEAKELTTSLDKWMELEERVVSLKGELKSEDELYSTALKTAKGFKNIFGEDFYIEMQYHSIKAEAMCFPKTLKVARELNIPLVATNDVHIVNNSEEERLKRQILKSIRFDEFKEESEGDAELYFKNESEMREALLQILPEDAVDEAISNTVKIFDQLNVSPEKESHYPKYNDGTNRNANKILEAEIEKGIKWRFPNGMDELHQKRLAHELPVIEDMGYADYHLIVKDFLEYGRLCGFIPEEKLSEAPLTIPELQEWIDKNGWKNPGFTVGPGRGSAVGSLICYLLGITNLDPLDYDLLFERFLNPERISMPDIDSDLSQGVREKTIDYVRNKYGNKAVCLIMTKNAQAPKGCIRIAARFYGQHKYGEKLTSLGDKLAKMVPTRVGVKFNSPMDEENKEGETVYEVMQRTISEMYVNDEKTKEDALQIIRWASIIEGSFTSYGEHAAGVVISDNDDISDYLPLRYNSSSEQMDTQCNMVQVEDNGLLKMDFLGLKTLNIITDAMRFIEQEHGVIINPLEIDVNDSEVYETILAKGLTNAVFQFESDGMKAMLKKFKPSCFEDLIILVSMFRPGPLQYLDDVIQVKNGSKEMTFLCDELKPILGKTYGAIVYQEQVMEIFQKLAGYTLGQADLVRRFMSKKKADKLAHEKVAFIQGDKKRGIEGFVKRHLRLMNLSEMSKEEVRKAVLEARDIADKLFTQMQEFAKYAFNKSHATAYAFNAFVTAWLKHYYPAEFFAAAMNWAINKKIPGLMHEAKICGVVVKCPDINLSAIKFTVCEGEILFGLGAIKGIKSNAEKIIEARKERPFTDVKEFIVKCGLSTSNIESLISAGALDSLCDNRAAMKVNIEAIKDSYKKIVEKKQKIEALKLVCDSYDTLKTDEDLVTLQTSHSLPVSFSKLQKLSSFEKKLNNLYESLRLAQDLFDSYDVVDIEEDKLERMNLEKEFLGMYVTAHPIDLYPEQENIPEVDEVCENTEKIFGVIEDMQVKHRKSDNAELAFFELSDHSGSVKVAVFTKMYATLKDVLQEGHAYILRGKTISEVVDVDENGNEIKEYMFVCEQADEVEKELCPMFMEVSSYPIFHITDEKEFIKKYAVKKGGHPLYIYDEMGDEMRLATYKVSEDALNAGCVM